MIKNVKTRQYRQLCSIEFHVFCALVGNIGYERPITVLKFLFFCYCAIHDLTYYTYKYGILDS